MGSFAIHRGAAAASAASDTVAGLIEIAVQSEMEAATDTTRAVAPGRVQYHPGVAKSWITFNGTGTIAVTESHNITSITDDGTGDYTVTIATDHSTATYCVLVGSTQVTTPTFSTHTVCDTQAAGSYTVFCRNEGNTAEDMPAVYGATFGDQA